AYREHAVHEPLQAGAGREEEDQATGAEGDAARAHRQRAQLADQVAAREPDELPDPHSVSTASAPSTPSTPSRSTRTRVAAWETRASWVTIRSVIPSRWSCRKRSITPSPVLAAALAAGCVGRDRGA